MVWRRFGEFQNFLVGTLPATPDERVFTDRLFDERGTDDARLFLKVLVLVCVISIVNSLFARPEVRLTIAATFAGLMMITPIWGLVRRTGLDVRRYALGAQIVSGVAMLWLGRYAAETLQSVERSMLAPAIFVVPAGALILVCPYRGRTTVAFAAGILIVGALLFARLNPPFAVVFAGMILSVLVAKVGSHARVRSHAVQEFRLLATLMPASVARRGGSFAALRRACVCISTDLKSYDAIVAAAGKEAELAPYLGRIYAASDRLLRAFFPNGNYCADWIAGELFIVVFEEEGGLRPQTVVDAVAFCRALLAEGGGSGSLTSHIGISAGEAFLGMLGPAGMRKATALGEVAGRARRFQQSGWVVQEHGGPTASVVVFGADVATCLDESLLTAGGSVQLSEAMRLRDLSDRNLYYLGSAVA